MTHITRWRWYTWITVIAFALAMFAGWRGGLAAWLSLGFYAFLLWCTLFVLRIYVIAIWGLIFPESRPAPTPRAERPQPQG